MKHFVSISETPTAEIQHVLDVALTLRAERRAGKPNQPVLAHKTLAMIFEKPSLRTRTSFEQAMFELGGHSIVMGSGEVGLGTRESPKDVALVLSGMVHGIMARVFEHRKLLELAQYSTVPVINALSDYSHPCQALADALTLMDEFGRDIKGRTVAFIGDGNNVARSLATLCGKLGVKFIIASPPAYSLEPAFQKRLFQQVPGVQFEMTTDPRAAVAKCDAIYTDTWVSMGQEEEKAQRQAAFGAYQVNAALIAAAPKHAIVMHDLPAYRNVEITDEVLDGPRSRVFPQAHNRLHAQKGLLAVLMAGV